MDKLSDLVTRLIDSKNPELITYQDRIDYAEESIHYILPDLAGVEILDKKDVVANADGKTLKANLDTNRSYILYDKKGSQVRTLHGKDLFEKHFGKEKAPSKSLIDKFKKERLHEKRKVR